MKKITLLSLLFSLFTFYGFTQTMVDDFESGSGNLLNEGGGITSAVVTNPNQTGLNTTANCLEFRRTGGQWWIFRGIDVNDIAISSSDTKYLSMMVHFPAQADLGLRFDAPDDASNGVEIVRALNSYTNFNQWQEIIFEIKDDDDTATSFTLGTLFRLSFHPDMGFENDPAGQILDNTSAFGYIDQIQILDSNPLLSNDQFNLEESISVFQNPSKSNFRIVARNNVNITDVVLYDMLGSRVKNISKIDNEYDMSNLSSGLYIVKILDDKGATISKKLVKQ
ncbi:T9SS type A sorting domain-containing protein [Hyunsoonleella ulvae]|uniref:T9SS type A sorting domain-containing protein n=1 Tax=Hyunsoonleella ulvae TaxID=2799948 RepID=UPI00193A136A|nr:T9SS type A sorting domain-containing protein [Hyunsoonleella ulvae]